MDRYVDLARGSFEGYARYLWHEMTHPGWSNYFYLLVVLSFLLFIWEQLLPWRRNQPRIREGFWLDLFYLFFNFFGFSLVGYNAVSDVAVTAFADFLKGQGIENLVALEVASWPTWSQLLLMFFLRDFIHYWVHRLLHRVPWLWRFHMVHHSVRQMGFAAHLRFHWMETVIYRTLEYLPLAMIGFGIQEFFLVHTAALLIGHWNHGNIRVCLGPLRHVISTPQFHIWHHVKELPPERPFGLNYGVSLSLWDHLFGTAYWPESGRDLELGFDHVETYPRTFWGQLLEPFRGGRG